jgi:hypothetical protein
LKKILYFFAFIFCFSPVFSQNTKDSSTSKIKAVIKLYPLQLLTGEFRSSCEILLPINISLEIGIGYIYALDYREIVGFESWELSPNLDNVSGLAIRPSIRYYFSKNKSHSGLFCNFLYLFKHVYNGKVSETNPSLTESINTFGFQLLSGYKISHRNYFFELYGGVGVRKIYDNYDWHGTGNPIYNSGTDIYIRYTPQVGLAIGFFIASK